MKFKAPDSIDPIEGWKILYWDGSQLRSPMYDVPWPKNERAVAVCGGPNFVPNSRGSSHQTPMEGCGCGLYMVSTPGEALHYAQGHNNAVLVKLKGWGKVIPATHGARVEFAYPAEAHVLEWTCGPRVAASALAERLERDYEIKAQTLSISKARSPEFLNSKAQIYNKTVLKKRMPFPYFLTALFGTQFAVHGVYALTSGKTTAYITAAVTGAALTAVLGIHYWLKARMMK